MDVNSEAFNRDVVDNGGYRYTTNARLSSHLANRRFTAATLAVADFQGYLHWLDKTTGELVARERISKERITNSPAAVGDTIVVLSDGGKMAAFRASPAKAAAGAATTPAAEPAPTEAPTADPIPPTP